LLGDKSRFRNRVQKYQGDIDRVERVLCQMSK